MRSTRQRTNVARVALCSLVLDRGVGVAAHVPIHRTKDAGRGFWPHKQNEILASMCTLRSKYGKILAVMSSNVDDLLYASLPDHDMEINEVLETFAVRKVDDTPFRSCGKELDQSDDYSIKVTARTTPRRSNLFTSRKAGDWLTGSMTRRTLT